MQKKRAAVKIIASIPQLTVISLNKRHKCNTGITTEGGLQMVSVTRGALRVAELEPVGKRRGRKRKSTADRIKMEIAAKKPFNFLSSSGCFKNRPPLDSWKHCQYSEQTKVRENIKSFVSFSPNSMLGSLSFLEF